MSNARRGEQVTRSSHSEQLEFFLKFVEEKPQRGWGLMKISKLPWKLKYLEGSAYTIQKQKYSGRFHRVSFPRLVATFIR